MCRTHNVFLALCLVVFLVAVVVRASEQCSPAELKEEPVSVENLRRYNGSALRMRLGKLDVVLSLEGASTTYDAALTFARKIGLPTDCQSMDELHEIIVRVVRRNVRAALVSRHPAVATAPEEELFSGPDWTQESGFHTRFLELVPVETTQRMLEIGTFEGRTALFMMKNSPATVTLDCIEYATPFDVFQRALGPYMEQGRVKYIRSSSFHALARMAIADPPVEPYDFIYVDGCHMATRTLEDLVLAFRLLRVGGIMAIDDYTWLRAERPPNHRPEPAVDGFLASFAGELTVLVKAKQVWVRKLAPESTELCHTELHIPRLFHPDRGTTM